MGDSQSSAESSRLHDEAWRDRWFHIVDEYEAALDLLKQAFDLSSIHPIALCGVSLARADGCFPLTSTDPCPECWAVDEAEGSVDDTLNRPRDSVA